MAATPGCRVGNIRINNHYENGTMTSLNGFSGIGLLCNKGERLYNTSVKRPFFFVPKDTPMEEEFRSLTQEAAPGVMDYYAISNYGRLLNKFSGKIMKENTRPNGYGYYCLASEKGQSKYTSHILVGKMFLKNDDPETKVQLNHINGNKLDNYVNKKMPDGSIKSNLEWVTPKENVIKSYETGLKTYGEVKVLTEDRVRDICQRLERGDTIASIHRIHSDVAYGTIKLIQKRRSWAYISKDYNF